MLRYRRSELRKIKEAASRAGQEAYALSLQRDTEKLKGLPQILAILRSSAETYDRERHQIEKEEKEVQASMIEPLLDQAAESRIRMPLHMNLTQEEARSMLEQADNLDVLLAYGYELETDQKHKDQYALHALVGEIKERQLAHEKRTAMTSSASTPDRVQNDDTISRINKLFDREGSILNKVNTLLQYEKRWSDIWSDNFTTRLDAGTAL
ncbi:hypothetical protein BCR43DRAFT_508676 [Syncephalastrum racemosum]|uniref:Uncharacterized protein n=1 Tax=Syncephalastrum racemosum TaxID=13706 RepID=A0A1X2H1B4_SYNRA|nr:hypothetical protein BCR43DRAFT_508676 [Syncephalastrum racemosum]